MLFFSVTSASALLRDEVIEESLADKTLEQPITNLNYNYESTEKVPIKLNILKQISTKTGDLYDGQIINFKVKEDVYYNNQLIVKKDTIATAEIETIIERGMNGLPATIILDDFKINNIPQNKLKCTIIHKGHNRAYYVFPIKWILTPTIIGGYLANFLLGGHSKINKRKTLTIYYYPHWAEQI